MSVGAVRKLVAGASRPDRIGRLRRRIAATHPLDFNRNFDSLVFVAGSGRSGTTWLVDLLNADRSYRVIFEPLTFRLGALGGRQLPRYVRPSTRDPELTATVERILLARFKSTQWTARGNDRLFSTRRIVKDVQSNLRLAWMRESFPPFPIILIIRHPCAVAASRDRLRNVRPIDEFLEDSRLVEDHLAPLAEQLTRLESPFEVEIARWCIETHIPLKQMAEGLELEVVLYEQLVSNPSQVLEPVFNRLGRKPPAALVDRLGVPSLTAYRPDAPLPSTARAVDEWQERVTDEQLQRALELVDLFGLGWLYGEDPRPRVSAVAQRIPIQ
jgi:Sulfotransferase family